ncbi:hypothetical protein CCR94_21535 [Rhodoblastus sphagnicola]|uniref:Bacteriophage phiJL001 Gp84 C-terminal domain-containing protein n=1 Tax=Rhodoblastus sphagnicola TaxID=333368 RepID=A0A2S6MWW9_9HYPH|nr:DUF2163 domain-containing protein [Rhodoblastus sphagnicola]MBB4200685.1 putative phage protein (TIGR02218 family) [Rhodoblastus sphagnicola]PPQ26848.1 hypothetical protein CCR94_21535 [Rhodoblastus sphagnicola]
MKSAPAALISYLNALRPTSDAPLLTAECFTIWLSTGTVLTYTDLDRPVAINGFTYLANSVLISGLKYRASCGVNVDSQQVTLFARATDTIGGIPFLQAMQQGLLDCAEIQREKVFFSDWNTPIGSVILFKGRVAQIDSIGRSSAQITVASDLVLLDIDMPRNVYQADCQHVLYDAQCGLAAGTYSTAGAVGAGSTQTMIAWSAATAAYQQGTIAFTSGANTGADVTIKAASNGSLILSYPLPYPPATGDTFVATYGCDRTMNTCKSRFNNLGKFRGFPFVPPPQIMTGPLSSVTSRGAKGGK